MEPSEVRLPERLPPPVPGEQLNLLGAILKNKITYVSIDIEKPEILPCLCQKEAAEDNRKHAVVLLQSIAIATGKTYLKYFFKDVYPNGKQSTKQKKTPHFRSQ